jgi:hypothetical protein
MRMTILANDKIDSGEIPASTMLENELGLSF